MIGPLIPASESCYCADCAALLEILTSLKPNATQHTRAFNPYPFALTSAEVIELGRIQACLRRDHCCGRTLLPGTSDYGRCWDCRPQWKTCCGSLPADPIGRGESGRISCTEPAASSASTRYNARFPINGFLLSHVADRAIRAALIEIESGSNSRECRRYRKLPRCSGAPSRIDRYQSPERPGAGHGNPTTKDLGR